MPLRDSSVEFPGKFYSFDVKGQYCALLGIPDLMAQMATETDRLVDPQDRGYRPERRLLLAR